MFFSIGHAPMENYPCHWQLGSFSVSTDLGWNLTTQGSNHILYKGYADNGPMNTLLELIVSQPEPCLTGNFCALVFCNDRIKIHTDRYRSFPIYIGNGVNNLYPTTHTAWADSLVIVNSDLSIIENKFNVIGQIDPSPLSPSQALEKISNILDQKTISFIKHNQLPIRTFLSGGVDSMLVYSFLKKYTDQFEMVKCSHVDYDYFWLKNSGDITKHWGYTQIHHWNDPCVLTSGTPGDEYMLRSPVTADLFLKHHGLGIFQLLQEEKWKNCLHYDYFSRSKHIELFKQQQAPVQSLEQMHYSLCNIVVNDWQHWHLGNTLTWTPLRDLEIFKTMLRLPLDYLLDQIMSSKFSIQLIEQNCSGLSTAISDSKNTRNMLANLVKVFQ